MKIHYFGGVVLGTLMLAACSSPSATTILTVVEHAETDVVTDIGEAGDSVGDVLTFANPVFDAANSVQVGTSNGYCFRTAVGSAWECHWILTLSDGQITVDGPFYDAADSVLAITGGTGAYSQARGEMALHARNAQGTEYDFAYTIVK
ncbi:MAG: allene oxide cyclase family protein [Anaerolineales bacterium]